MAFASRQSAYSIAALGSIIQAATASADVLHHSLIQGPRTLSPPLLLFYAALVVTLYGVWMGLRPGSSHNAASLLPNQFVNVAGLKLAGLGCAIELFAPVWSEVAVDFTRGMLGFVSGFGILTLGLLTVCLGCALGLTIEYGMIRHEIIIASRNRKSLVQLLIVWTFSAIWLAAATYLIYLAWIYQTPLFDYGVEFFLALMAMLVLIPFKKVMPHIGSGICVGLAFNCVIYLIIVGYAESHAYAPWGLIPTLLFELAFDLLGGAVAFKSSAIISSLLPGVSFYALYYPFTTYLFPWSLAPQVLIVIPVLGSAVGALLGVKVYTSLSSAVLGDVTASV